MKTTNYNFCPHITFYRIPDLACIILFIAAVFASGYTPPGVAGEVIRHNRDADIDASPFFYGDVDNMLELIEGAERLWRYRSIENEREIGTQSVTSEQEK